MQRIDLEANAPRVAEEAVALLTAHQCPPGVHHRDPGREPGWRCRYTSPAGTPSSSTASSAQEAAYAGTSFLTTDKLGTFRYGSEAVTMTADATLPGALGTFGWDDEGVPAQRVEVVKEGRFVGYLTDRENASRLSLPRSIGAARASGWNRIPLVRMTNVSLEPGTWTLDDLVADTDDGLYLETNRSWSIDDRRLNFQFGTEVAYEIKGGKRGALLRNATYTGITPRFWGNCDAICNQDHWVAWGTPNSARGSPRRRCTPGTGRPRPASATSR